MWKRSPAQKYEAAWVPEREVTQLERGEGSETVLMRSSGRDGVILILPRSAALRKLAPAGVPGRDLGVELLLRLERVAAVKEGGSRARTMVKQILFSRHTAFIHASAGGCR